MEFDAHVVAPLFFGFWNTGFIAANPGFRLGNTLTGNCKLTPVQCDAVAQRVADDAVAYCNRARQAEVFG